MFAWMLLASAVGSALPTPAQPTGSPARWVNHRDLPKIDRPVAVTTFDLIVDTSGMPTDCAIVIQSGYDRLDNAVCAALMKRSKFKPATNKGGTPVASAYRDRVRWIPRGSVFGGSTWVADPDIVVSTPKVTGQLKNLVQVVVLIDPASAGTECYVAVTSGKPDLDEQACATTRNPQISPAIVSKGAIVAGVRSFRVGFENGTSTSVQVR